ncbi:MAG: hypothetical protein IRZ32_08475 [Solirubrobacteraceae bacterium]|nr:hypothetical protein [Solirubrobacteraceae bacterium]
MVVFVIIDVLVVLAAIGFAVRTAVRGPREPAWWPEFERDFRAYAARRRPETR